MPLTQIYLRAGKPESYRRGIADGVQEALAEVLGVPREERFQVITEADPGNFIFDPSFLGINRSPDFVLIVVTLKAGRTDALKEAFYQGVTEKLSITPGMRPEDVGIVLYENAPANWSFGNGVAQLLHSTK